MGHVLFVTVADIVVVGAGLGGIASALRLAKLGHSVTLFERAEHIGGALRPVAADGYVWDSETTTLPGALRDLFRKSGRPLEKELELVHVDPMREHRFSDGATLVMPSGSRAAQVEAVDAALGSGQGTAWVDYAHSFADDWDLLRRNALEQPWTRGDKQVDRRLATRSSLLRRVTKSLREERLVSVALHHAKTLGHDPRNVPEWFGIVDYLEQNFGSWAAPGGLGPVLDVLEARLGTRGVKVVTGNEVLDVVIEHRRVRAVKTVDGWLDTDLVVVAVDPRQLPSLTPYVARTSPSLAPVTTLLGLREGAPIIEHEVVLHGDPTITIRPGGHAPEGGQAWMLTSRGRLSEDIVVALARLKVDVREFIEVRHDLSPAAQARVHGSSFGVLWQGPRTFERSLHAVTPIEGLHVAGAASTVAALVPFVTLTAAQVAEAVGPA